MQYVNDDMDELFKRAAEDYPLDTSSADWNKVLAALQGETNGKTISEDKRNKNGRLLWLLLLLPLGLICNQFNSPGSLNNSSISKNSSNFESVRSTAKVTDTQKREDEHPKTTTNETGNEDNSDVKTSKTPSAVSAPLLDRSGNNYSSSAYFSKNKKKMNEYGSSYLKSNSKAYEFGDNDLAREEIFSGRNYVSVITLNKSLNELSPTIVGRKLNLLIDPVAQDSKKPVTVSRRKLFYIGLMGGVDATTVKFQKIENAGTSYGLLLGYQFNKKWSVEGGAYVEKKYYYTEGTYFNASKIYPNMPANYWLDNISGNCKMVEVPVSFKYNLSSQKKSSWFATMGTSSYFMKSQRYLYDYYYGSTSSYGRHEKDITKPSKNFFSNLSLSAGYTHRLGNFGDLRLEPYLKVPVTGIGVGSLPLFSGGMQIGVTRKF